MSCVKLRVCPPVRPEEWREKREARRRVLDAVRARRRQMITQTKRTPPKTRD